MAKMGRPEIHIDKPTFETLMGIAFVTEAIIGEFFKVSESTLIRWVRREYGTTFDNLKQQKQKNLKLKLAGKQYETAMKGNVSMQIWLGKQWLGQSDKMDQNLNNPDGKLGNNSTVKIYIPSNGREKKDEPK